MADILSQEELDALLAEMRDDDGDLETASPEITDDQAATRKQVAEILALSERERIPKAIQERGREDFRRTIRSINNNNPPQTVGQYCDRLGDSITRLFQEEPYKSSLPHRLAFINAAHAPSALNTRHPSATPILHSLLYLYQSLREERVTPRSALIQWQQGIDEKTGNIAVTSTQPLFLPQIPAAERDESRSVNSYARSLIAKAQKPGQSFDEALQNLEIGLKQIDRSQWDPAELFELAARLNRDIDGRTPFGQRLRNAIYDRLCLDRHTPFPDTSRGFDPKVFATHLYKEPCPQTCPVALSNTTDATEWVLYGLEDWQAEHSPEALKNAIQSIVERLNIVSIKMILDPASAQDHAAISRAICSQLDPQHGAQPLIEFIEQTLLKRKINAPRPILRNIDWRIFKTAQPASSPELNQSTPSLSAPAPAAGSSKSEISLVKLPQPPAPVAKASPGTTSTTKSSTALRAATLPQPSTRPSASALTKDAPEWPEYMVDPLPKAIPEEDLLLSQNISNLSPHDSYQARPLVAPTIPVQTAADVPLDDEAMVLDTRAEALEIARFIQGSYRDGDEQDDPSPPIAGTAPRPAAPAAQPAPIAPVEAESEAAKLTKLTELINKVIPKRADFEDTENKLQGFKNMFTRFLDELDGLLSTAKRADWPPDHLQTALREIANRIVTGFGPLKLQVLCTYITTDLRKAALKGNLRDIIAAVKADRQTTAVQVEKLKVSDIEWSIFKPEPSEPLLVRTEAVSQNPDPVLKTAQKLDADGPAMYRLSELYTKMKAANQKVDELLDSWNVKNQSKAKQVVAILIQNLLGDACQMAAFPPGSPALDEEFKLAFKAKLVQNHTAKAACERLIDLAFEEDCKREGYLEDWNKVKKVLVDTFKNNEEAVAEVFNFTQKADFDSIFTVRGQSYDFASAPTCTPDARATLSNIQLPADPFEETVAPEQPAQAAAPTPLPTAPPEPEDSIITSSDIIAALDIPNPSAILPPEPRERTVETFRAMLLQFCDNLDQFIAQSAEAGLPQDAEQVTALLLDCAESTWLAQLPIALLRSYVKASFHPAEASARLKANVRQALSEYAPDSRPLNFNIFNRPEEGPTVPYDPSKTYSQLGAHGGLPIESPTIPAKSAAELFDRLGMGINFTAYLGLNNPDSYRDLTRAFCHKLDALFRSEPILRNSVNKQEFIGLILEVLQPADPKVYSFITEFIALVSEGDQASAKALYEGELNDLNNYGHCSEARNIFHVFSGQQADQAESIEAELAQSGSFTVITTNLGRKLTEKEARLVSADIEARDLIRTIINENLQLKPFYQKIASFAQTHQDLTPADKAKVCRIFTRRVWPGAYKYGVIGKIEQIITDGTYVEGQQDEQNLPFLLGREDELPWVLNMHVDRVLPNIPPSPYEKDNARYKQMIQAFTNNVERLCTDLEVSQWPASARADLSRLICERLNCRTTEQVRLRAFVIYKVNGFDKGPEPEDVAASFDKVKKQDLNWYIFIERDALARKAELLQKTDTLQWFTEAGKDWHLLRLKEAKGGRVGGPSRKNAIAKMMHAMHDHWVQYVRQPGNTWPPIGTNPYRDNVLRRVHTNAKGAGKLDAYFNAHKLRKKPPFTGFGAPPSLDFFTEQYESGLTKRILTSAIRESLGCPDPAAAIQFFTTKARDLALSTPIASLKSVDIDAIFDQIEYECLCKIPHREKLRKLWKGKDGFPDWEAALVD